MILYVCMCVCMYVCMYLGIQGFRFCFTPTVSVGNPWRLYPQQRFACLIPVQSYGLDHIALSVEQVSCGRGWGGRIKVPLFPIAYCIDTVVDTQVQQVATAQTLRKSKVAAPVVLFYFLFLCTRKGETPCRCILSQEIQLNLSSL